MEGGDLSSQPHSAIWQRGYSNVLMKRLLVDRKDIFADHRHDVFDQLFGGRFRVVRKDTLSSTRVLYLAVVK
jgi:hypothetical protein